MKKLLVIIIIGIVLLYGCENKNFSKENMQKCKETINTVDKYLKGDIDEIDAYEIIENIKIENDDALSDESKANAKRSMIEIMFWGHQMKEMNKKDKEKLIKRRNELAEICGLKKYKE